jgi:hypothetical protein
MNLCACGCGEPAVYAARHCHKRLRTKITADDYLVEDSGYISPCFIWKGRKGGRHNKYAMVRLRGQEVYVHRAMYEQEVGPIPDGMQIDHLCRVPRCIRPEHLEPVTHTENQRRKPAIKMTIERAAEVRKSTESARALAERFGVSEFTIYQIRSGRIWREAV